MKRRELTADILAALDGRLDPEQAARLEARLLADPEAMRLYLEHVELHSALECRFLARRSLRSEGVVPIEKIIRLQHRRILQWSLAAAAALVLAAALSLTVIHTINQPADTFAFEAAPGSVFDIDSPDASRPEGSLPPGSTIRLLGGSLKIDLDRGVSALIEGPCTFHLAAGDLVELEGGRGRFKVPSRAAGFTVVTPELRAVDLGTEFAVASPLDALDEVHVFKGRVRVTHPLRDSVTATLSAGEACRFESLSPVLFEAEPDRFLSDLPDSVPHLRIPLDEVDDDRIAVAGDLLQDDPPVLKLRNAASKNPAIIPGPVGNALDLSGTDAWIDSDWPGLEGDAPRTITLWVRFEPGAQRGSSTPAMIGWGGSLDNKANRKWKVWFNRDSEDRLVPGIEYGAEQYNGEQPVDDGRWHHVAFVHTGRTLADGRPEARLYLDGQPAAMSHRLLSSVPPAERDAETDTTSAGSVPFRIAYGMRPGIRGFDGALDDLRIYDGVLSPAQISQLHEDHQP